MKYFWIVVLVLLTAYSYKAISPLRNFRRTYMCVKFWFNVYDPNQDALIKMCEETNSESVPLFGKMNFILNHLLY
jgi:hypothetical protein